MTRAAMQLPSAHRVSLPARYVVVKRGVADGQANEPSPIATLPVWIRLVYGRTTPESGTGAYGEGRGHVARK